MKKIIYFLLVILCLSSIFFFSSKNSTESNGLSKKLINDTISIINNITHKEYDKKSIVNKLNYPIRKCAHFTLFLILGVCIYLLLNAFNISNRFILSIILCIVFAILDETHQLFSLGRSSSILDILIDSMGSIVGIIIIFFIKK